MTDPTIYQLAALGAALSWAFAGIISIGPSTALGAIPFNRIRMGLVFLMLFAVSVSTGGWQTLESSQILLIILSGFIGIFLGDTALFFTLNRMGPRRTSILFALNAPISVILGWVIFGDILTLREMIGIAIIFAGVVLAIGFGKRRSQLHQWETIKGPVWIGITLGLFAALFQSAGALIIVPVMTADVDAVSVSAARVGIAALLLQALRFHSHEGFHSKRSVDKRLLAQILLSGFLGMGLGMTLYLFALNDGDVGIISTLSATAPALILPLVWWSSKEVPASGAWIGAGCVVVGCWFLFT